MKQTKGYSKIFLKEKETKLLPKKKRKKKRGKTYSYEKNPYLKKNVFFLQTSNLCPNKQKCKS
jgi:hypothetical protein